MKIPAEIDPTNQVVFATRQDDEVRSKSVPPPAPSGFALLFLLDDVDSARAVALLEGLPVRTDRGMVDSGGRIVGVESGSVVVRIIVVEESREASADGVAVSVTKLAGVEKTVLVLVFAVAINVGDSASEGLSEDVQDVTPAVTDPVSFPSSPAAPGSGSEPSGTFGQSFATASPENNIPINESGSAIVPLQALLTLIVSFSRNSMQPEEHALPLIKSVAVQPVRGVL